MNILAKTFLRTRTSNVRSFVSGVAHLAALASLSLALPSVTSAQTKAPSQPISETTKIWDPATENWGAPISSFTMTWGTDPSVSSNNGKFKTTYSGFVPVATQSYSSRFYWNPQQTYSRVQIDTIMEGGVLRPVRLDVYDRSTPRKTVFTRSSWTGTEWRVVQRSTSMTDTLGILVSQATELDQGAGLIYVDSTHVTVRQDLKGNVLGVKIDTWTLQSQKLTTMAEQKYTLAGDGSIQMAEIHRMQAGQLTPMYRLRDIEWVDFGKNFTYVPIQQDLQLLYGGNSYRTAIIDMPNGTEWSEFGTIQNNFDEQNRIIAYNFNGSSRDSFAFNPDGTIGLNQYDEVFGNQWMASKGTRTVQTYDDKDRLISVLIQKYDAGKMQYVNDRVYTYAYGTSSVKPANSGSDMMLVPNPAQALVRVLTESEVSHTVIYDATGRVVLTSQGEQFDVSSLPAGAYTVIVQGPNGSVTQKLIKYQ
jgi:hypothetical protein